MKRIATYITAFISLATASCISATAPGAVDSPDKEIPEEGHVSISYLKSLCDGLSASVTKDISIVGSVIATDLYGEFYKSIIMVDGSGGIEINIDKEDLYIDFPIYTEIAVSCNGLSLGRVGGKIVLGAAPAGDYTVDRIGAEDMDRYISITADSPASAEPISIGITDISAEDITSYVRLDDVRFYEADGETSFCDFVDGEYVTTNRTLTDCYGNTLTVKTSGQCSYAHETLPTGEISITGIIDYSSNHYFLRIVNHSIRF